MVRPVVVSGTATSRARIGRGSMRLWTVVGQGTHMTCLYVAAAAAYAWLPALYTCLLVFAVGMNIVVAALLVSGASPFHVRG
jgi:hypothetical protein